MTNNRFLNSTDSEAKGNKVQLLELAAVRCDCGTQIRASIHETTVGEYAEAMSEGVDFPSVIVFHDGNQYVLADGFHRIMAATRRGYTQISADVRRGTKSDALKYALSANAQHGLKRSNADKRRSVELALAEWPKTSDRHIAEICAVSNRFVSDMRQEISTVNGSQLNGSRIGADGKERRMPRRNPESLSVSHTDHEEQPAVNGEQKTSPGGTTLVAEEESPRIKTYDQEVTELRNTKTLDPKLKSEVEYHLNLVRADAEIVLDRIQNDLIEPDDLKDCATELRFAAKTVEALRASMEWPGIKQSSARN